MQFFTVIGLVLTILGASGAHFHVLSPILGFTLFALGIVVTALVFFPAILEFFRYGLRQTPMLSLLAGLVCLGGIGFAIKLSVENPINDVSTSPNSGLNFRHKSYRIPIPADFPVENIDYLLKKEWNPTVAAQVSIVYPDLKPLRFAEGADLVFPKAKQALSNLANGWKVVDVNEQGYAMELEKESAVFRFVDDIMIEVRPFEDGVGKSEIHIRSRSRVGRSDLGANRKNIDHIFMILRGIAPALP